MFRELFAAGALLLALGLSDARAETASRPTAAAARTIQSPAPNLTPAVDGILDAFRTHPLVGLSDRHNLAQEGALYSAIVRDPRFATEVGNLVVEFGGSARQATIDRFVSGEAVPYGELRQVWTDVVGWTPGEIGQMYLDLFATVRAVNARLPRERHIRVWLGEPPIDWATIKSQDDLVPLLGQRDDHPARLIEAEILSKARKALVIYGGGHFASAPPRIPSLGYIVERDHPGAFFFITTYAGYDDPRCTAAFEAKTKSWPAPSLATPIVGTWLAPTLSNPDCIEGVRFMSPPGAPPVSREQQARRDAIIAEAKLRHSGAWMNALLYLGPSASLTLSPREQALYLDASYQAEGLRRRSLMPGPDMVSPTTALDTNTQAHLPYVRGAPPKPGK